MRFKDVSLSKCTSNGSWESKRKEKKRKGFIDYSMNYHPGELLGGEGQSYVNTVGSSGSKGHIVKDFMSYQKKNRLQIL